MIECRDHKTAPADFFPQLGKQGNRSPQEHDGDKVFKDAPKGNPMICKVFRIDQPVYHIRDEQI